MKNYLIAVLAVFLSTTLSAFADPPPGVGAANVTTGPCMGTIAVGPPGNFVPFLPGGLGFLRVEYDGKVQVVHSNSAQGNYHLSCHGKFEAGELIQGFDVITGAFAEGIIVSNSEACAAGIALGLPDLCRGEGENTTIINGPEFRGLPCTIGVVPTFNWKSVVSPSGKAVLSCHANE